MNASNIIPQQVQAVEKLAYSRQELRSTLGVSNVTLWRLERRGLLRRVPNLRTPLYSRESVVNFLAGREQAA